MKHEGTKTRRIARMAGHFGGGAFLVVAFCLLGTAPAAMKVKISEIGAEGLIGALGAPPGTYMTIEGARMEDPSKGQSFFLAVDTVDGNKLPTSIVMEVRNFRREKDVGISGRCQLRGYEWAGMEGLPVDPNAPPTEQLPFQSRGVGFYHWFESKKVISIGRAIN